MSTLTVRQLSYCARHGRQRLVNINFDMDSGQRLAVIGPNGSGKSTLLRVLIGGLATGQGHISLAGIPLGQLTPAQRARKVAYLAQQDSPDPRLRVREYIALGRLPWWGASDSRQDQQAIDNAIAITELTPLCQRKLAELSGGERQRAALARALAQTPSLLLLDEPTNHLDPAGRAALLARVKALGISTVAVLHDLPAVDNFADRVLLLSEGRQIAFGPPDQVLSPEWLLPVLGMESFVIPHPTRGSAIRIFDTPLN